MSEDFHGDWTPRLVLEHIKALLEANDTRYREKFEGQEKAVNAALAAAEKAVNVAERNAEEWRKGANEWRGSMTDREKNFASRSEMEMLKERMDKHEGGGKGMEKLWGWIVAAFMAAVAAVGLLTRK